MNKEVVRIKQASSSSPLLAQMARNNQQKSVWRQQDGRAHWRHKAIGPPPCQRGSGQNKHNSLGGTSRQGSYPRVGGLPGLGVARRERAHVRRNRARKRRHRAALYAIAPLQRAHHPPPAAPAAAADAGNCSRPLCAQAPARHLQRLNATTVEPPTPRKLSFPRRHCRCRCQRGSHRPRGRNTNGNELRPKAVYTDAAHRLATCTIWSVTHSYSFSAMPMYR